MAWIYNPEDYVLAPDKVRDAEMILDNITHERETAQGETVEFLYLEKKSKLYEKLINLLGVKE